MLTTDSSLRDIIVRHPALLWKAHNARQHTGRANGERASESDAVFYRALNT